MNDPALDLQGITKSYNPGAPNEVRVLRGIDLQVAPGEVVALVAPPGRANPRFCILRGCWIRPMPGRSASGART